MRSSHELPQGRESGRAIGSIVTVVPAHNERRLLPDCLRSIECAAEAVSVPVETIVVLDSCSDGSGSVVPPSMRTVNVQCRNVGAARAAGFAASGSAGRADVWFATTDADSTVPASWLVDHLSHWADHDAVVGTVGVDWSEYSPRTRSLYTEHYGRRPQREHGHIHGANLGMRADLYHRIGGFRSLAVAEDVDLVNRMRAAGARIVWDEWNVVRTSDRRDPRARGGFGDYLRMIEHSAQLDHTAVQETT